MVPDENERTKKQTNNRKPLDAMKTKQQNQMNQITLKDGRSRLGTWSSETEGHLTIGDRIELPREVAKENPGYGPGAVVTRVEHSADDGLYHIEAEADCKIPANRRTVVTLNKDRVERSLRSAVETLIRKRVQLPLLEWENSRESTPVLRLHSLGEPPKASLPELQREVGQLLADAVQPIGV